MAGFTSAALGAFLGPLPHQPRRKHTAHDATIRCWRSLAMEPAVAAAEEEEDEENKTKQEVVNDNQRQTAVEMVENAAVK